MSLKPRLALLLAGACGLVLGLVILYRTPPEQNPLAPQCALQQMTGLHCPGCGGTRAVHALLHLRIGEALAKNVMVVVAIPFLAFWIVRGLWRWVRGMPPVVSQTMIKPWVVWTIVLGIFAFGVLRNLPWLPFTLL